MNFVGISDLKVFSVILNDARVILRFSIAILGSCLFKMKERKKYGEQHFLL
jgi:hypothetical protein